MNRTEILTTANEYITKDRAATHGNAENNFQNIADLWSAYMKTDVTAHDVAMLMTLFKVGRIKTNPTHKDSTIDACGYLALAGEIAGE
jgi:hypothetical protein